MSLEVKKIKGKNYYIRGTYRGVSVYKSTKTSNRKTAEEDRKAIEDEIDAKGRIRKQYTFADAVEKYIESGGSDRFILDMNDNKEWKPGPMKEFENVPLDLIDQIKLDEAAKKSFPNVKPQTLNRQFYTPTLAVLNHAAKLDMCESRKWMRPRVKKLDVGKRKWFRDLKEFENFFNQSSPHLRVIQLLLLYTGARPTEAIELDIQDLFLDKQWAVLNATKTDSKRGVPLHSIVVTALKTYIGKRKEGRVFLTPNGKPYLSKRDEDGTVRLGGGYFKTSWKLGMKRAKIKGYSPYSMRHTFNNMLIMQGVEPTTREALMGHDTGSTNSLYSDVPQDHLIRIVERLPHFTDFSRLISQKHVLFSLDSAKLENKKKSKKSRKTK